MAITDPEILEFIAQTEAAYPAAANLATAEDNRRYYDTMCEVFRKPRPESVTATDESVAGKPVRRYRVDGCDSRPFVLYSHGGGFTVGGLDSHDDVCAEIADATGMEVIATDYRLAPEHVYPAQLDDVADVWLAESARNDRSGIVVGDSAGGNLSAALCLRMRRLGGPMPVAQLLIYPGLGGDMTAPSYTENEDAPLLRGRDLKHYAGVYTGGDMTVRSTDPEASPLVADDFTGLPQAFVVTADVDPLRDDGKAYVEALNKAGVKAEWRNEPQLVHGYLRARHQSQLAADSFAAICRWLSQRLY